MNGKITQWHDDKGYGFIQADGSKKIFCHISDFASKQPRPQEGEIVAFDVVTNEQGKFAAKKIRYPNRPIPNHNRRNTGNRRNRNRSLFSNLLSYGLITLILGLIGYYQIYPFVAAKFKPKQKNTPQTAQFSTPRNTPKYRCDGRMYCSQMTSCEEATWFLQNCSGTKMDGNRDGIPCEKQWCR